MERENFPTPKIDVYTGEDRFEIIQVIDGERHVIKIHLDQIDFLIARLEEAKGEY